MAATFKPQVTFYKHLDSNGEAISHESRVERPKTYQGALPAIKKALDSREAVEVTVSRHRRGEWGEWFERWQLVGGKPKIVKQTWL